MLPTVDLMSIDINNGKNLTSFVGLADEQNSIPTVHPEL